MPRLATLAAQYAVPAIGPLREFATGGGLLSYGASVREVTRQAGVIAGRCSRARGRTICQCSNQPNLNWF
jgi:hypothetical protein